MRDTREPGAARVTDLKPLKPAVRRRLRNLAFCAGAILLAATGLYFFDPQSSGSSPAPAPKPVVRVDVATAVERPISSYVEALGTIFPRAQATLAAKMSGQIIKMRLWKNQLARSNDVIAVFQSSDILAQRNEAAAALAQARINLSNLVTATIPQNAAAQEKALQDARANVANAQALLDRRRELFAQGGISMKDLEASQLALTLAEGNLHLAERMAALRTSAVDPTQRALAEQQIKQAEQRVAQLDIQLGYAQVRAPFDGVITDQFQFEGDYVPAGARLVTIADMQEVIVKAAFADAVAARLHVGDSAAVLPADEAGRQLRGTVSLISNSVDPANRTVEIWVKLPNSDGSLRSGASARVRVVDDRADKATVIPMTAVTLDASTENSGTAMVVDSHSVAHERRVTIGIKSEGLVQVIAGVNPGELVVTNGGYALPDGTQVQISGPAQGGASPK